MQETQISTLANKQVHGKRGESHFLGGNQRKCNRAHTHTLGCSGACYRGKVNCVFLKQCEVFKVTIKWMFTPARHHFSLLPGAFCSRNQVLKTSFELTRLELPYRDIFHLFSGSFPQVFSSFFPLSTSLLVYLPALPNEALGPHSPKSLNLPAHGTHQDKLCNSAQKKHHLRSRNSVVFIQVVFIQIGQSTWAVIALIMD